MDCVKPADGAVDSRKTSRFDEDPSNILIRPASIILHVLDVTKK
jgi:hypothetical protein